MKEISAGAERSLFPQQAPIANHCPDTPSRESVLSIRHAQGPKSGEYSPVTPLFFDKGNNSTEAFGTLDPSPFHFIGSLVPSQHPDLLAVPADQFHELPGQRLAGCTAYRTRKKVFGQERTILITFNEHLLEGQMQGIQASLTKARRKLDFLQANLRRRREGRLTAGHTPTAESVRKQVEQICSGQFLKTLIVWDVAPGKVPVLTYRTDTAALARLASTTAVLPRPLLRERQTA